ncbi:MAG: acetyl-CoA carboxylase carboxyltransferase subunit alpha [Acholeplasmataceae bacterium]|nr:acetyl-CoA carboxylase carboxyltransferase subunit alpha [Acholeplasmataceae bacterium]
MRDAWEIVKLARHPKRPTSQDLIDYLFEDFIELKGDRLYQDDTSIIGGIGTLESQAITVIAEEKGTDTNSKIQRNFGMPHPEGYRKAIRLMKQAEKFNRPILTIIDTPGAYPGVGAEERGQAQAIAYNLYAMMGLKTPIITLVLSEGGSGGALAIGVGDKVFMFENSVFAILSPEGFASILYKDSSLASQAANLMKLTAFDLKELNIIDEIIFEGTGLHEDKIVGYKNLKKIIKSTFKTLSKIPIDELLKNRYERYRKIGVYLEGVEDESNV